MSYKRLFVMRHTLLLFNCVSVRACKTRSRVDDTMDQVRALARHVAHKHMYQLRIEGAFWPWR
jgi:hypothetical protein